MPWRCEQTLQGESSNPESFFFRWGGGTEWEMGTQLPMPAAPLHSASPLAQRTRA